MLSIMDGKNDSVIDFHVHAFPDRIAEYAIQTLEAECKGVRARHDGTVNGLIDSMNRAGIERAVVCSIATKPSQFVPILAWSKAILSDRLLPIPSVHPADPELFSHLESVSGEGFVGIKLHPYYQDFHLDDARVIELLRCARDNNLMVVVHTGFDIAFPRERRGDPARILKALEKADGLCFVATHLGGWEDWDEVERLLRDAPIYREISFAGGFLNEDRIRALIETAPEGTVLFGTDSPWNDQAGELERVRKMGLAPGLLEELLYENARKLLEKWDANPRRGG